MKKFDAATTFSAVLDVRLARRDVLRAALAATAASAGAIGLTSCANSGSPLGVTPLESAPITFTPITPSSADQLRVPVGYRATVLYRWGDAVGHTSGSPEFRMDAGNSADEQSLQCGMHNDGMCFFPLPGRDSSRGLLAMNHEYFDGQLLHPDGWGRGTLDKVRKEQRAVGVSVIELRQIDGNWSVVRPSPYARRIDALTSIAIGGPAAGNALMRTRFDPTGLAMQGTFAGCAHGWTPWGTYLTCEENFQYMFTGSAQPTSAASPTSAESPTTARYLLPSRPRYAWGAFDERFDATKHPNEFNRFGWVVEIDPFDPTSQPVKRTALGRFSHEGAAPAITRDGRVAFYMGDDQPFEYIYKFVTRDRWNPSDRTANRTLMDHGTLYAARFNANGSGDWLPLVHGVGNLTTANGFVDQASVLVYARLAAQAAGATPMDRPEWTAVHPVSGEVYCTLTNNSLRGRDGRPSCDAANPRNGNIFGHIIRWRETNRDAAATGFGWDVFALAGDPHAADEAKRGRFNGDAFGSPDGLYFDSRGLLWVATDVSPTALNRGDNTAFGNNQLLCVDPRNGVFKRFLTGPAGAEITGVTGTADGRTMFVNIQHPGEGTSANDPANPRRFSNWPDFDPHGRPRSATVVIRRDDGGVIGT